MYEAELKSRPGRYLVDCVGFLKRFRQVHIRLPPLCLDGQVWVECGTGRTRVEDWYLQETPLFSDAVATEWMEMRVSGWVWKSLRVIDEGRWFIKYSLRGNTHETAPIVKNTSVSAMS